MNLLVQKPIEKRVEDKYEPEKSNGFQSFDMNSESKSSEVISLKDVNGLHFEADLDAIQEHQESINIASDLKEAGINPRSDFETIEQQISNRYNQVEETLNPINDFSLMNDALQPVNSYTNTAVLESNPIEDFQNAEKNSIGVYKKAYDENQLNENQWEEVDFYETPTTDPVVSDTKNTTYINQTLRSGQILEADGNVVIIGDCHPGSEIRAIGDITIWGVLSGIAHAGCKGNINAKVRALKMNAVQLRIGNCYSRRPDGTNIPYIIRSSIFTPEEARVVDGEIMLFKINQN